MKTDQFVKKLKELDFVDYVQDSDLHIVIYLERSILADISKLSEFAVNTNAKGFKHLSLDARKELSSLIQEYTSTPILEREYATPFSVNPGDLVIYNKPNSAMVFFVEALDIDADGNIESILLVDGRKDKFFGREFEDQSVQSVKESLDDFYREFKLIAKKENLEN